ncbi:hypothetical protein ACLE20_15030 [Rhizobium sp. YIM 134829]|uniref:hypothetical protein n=1 Tax=Rhizobium sp. YIM 134829 TaxID=3390453 RepID=UPI00397AC0A3
MADTLKLLPAIFSWDLGSVLVDLGDGLGRRPLQEVLDEADEDIAIASKIEENVALLIRAQGRCAAETTERSGTPQADGHSFSTSKHS